MSHNHSDGRAARVAYSHSATDRAQPSHFESHCHDNFELLYVRHGRGKYVVEGAEYPLRSHTLLLIRPFEYHYVCPDKNSVYERYVFNFDRELLPESISDLWLLKELDKNRHGVYFAEEHISPAIRREFPAMDDAFVLLDAAGAENPLKESMALTVLIRVLLLLSLFYNAGDEKYVENIITRVTEYLDRNLTEDFSLDKLAQQFFVSKYYLCRAFRKQNGVSVLSYLTTKRIALAQQLLLRGEPATTVAYQVGFQSYSAFYRAYTKQTGGRPPRETKRRPLS